MKIGNLEVYGIIYKIVNKINNKVYIGQTIMKKGFYGRYQYTGKSDIERVYRYHKKRKDKNKSYSQHLINSIEKYGFNSFEVCVLLDVAFSNEELNIKEQCWISIFNSLNNGYNKNLGGFNRGSYYITEQHKINIGKAKRGFKHSDETKKRLSEVNLGKHHSDETKRKMSISKTGFKHTEEFKNNIKKRRIIQPTNHRKVVCLETKEVFISVAESSRQKNCSRTGISNCLRGTTRKCGGYHWMYYEEYINKKTSL